MDQLSGMKCRRRNVGGAIDYRDVVVASADLITVSGVDGRYRYASAACRTLFGWEPGQLVGQLEADLVHPDDLASLRTSRAECTTDDQGTTSFRFRCRDGSWRWTEATSRHMLIDGLALVVS